MNRDRRTVRDCIEMTAELAKAMGLNHIKHPSTLEPGDPKVAGLAYENHQGGSFLLMRVDERGHRSYPFGNVPMKYSEFWIAGCFALACMDLLKNPKRQQEIEERTEFVGRVLASRRQEATDPYADVPECSRCGCSRCACGS